MNISTEDLIAALRSLKQQTGSIDCSGCGREHDCSTSGCALIREAADQLERLNDFSNSQITDLLKKNSALQAALPRWISVNEALPESPFTVVLAIVYASNGHLTFNGAYQLATYDPTDGWYLDDYPAEFDRITVTHWMPLPEPPEETGREHVH